MTTRFNIRNGNHQRAHLLIECWDAERPATLSERILTQQLRQHLGFEGLMCEAVTTGRISPKRIRASVERIWQAKRKVSKGDPQDRPHQKLAQSNALKLGADILQASQIVRGSPLQLTAFW